MTQKLHQNVLYLKKLAKMIFFFSILFLLASFSVNSSLQENSTGYNACSVEYQNSLIAEMNLKRYDHYAPDLLLNNYTYELIVYAQERADFLAEKGPEPFKPNIPFSEFDGVLKLNESAQLQVDDMYHIGDDYPYYGEEPPADSVQTYGVFTQMIWVASQWVTFGCSDVGGNTRYFAAVFYPPGNVQGEYARNVLPPRHRAGTSG